MIVFVLKINMYKIWIEPVIEERFDTDRTILTLEFIKKQAKKANEEKQAILEQRYMSILHSMMKLKQKI